jgi:hypothetical protein
MRPELPDERSDWLLVHVDADLDSNCARRHILERAVRGRVHVELEPRLHVH